MRQMEQVLLREKQKKSQCLVTTRMRPSLVFDLLTENWHTGYPCPREHWDNGVFLRFFVFELGACIHATDGKTRNMAY